MPRPSLHRIVLLSAVALPLLASSPAAAQPAPVSALYDDVKEVIGDVISQEISKTIAPNVACLAGRVSAKQGDPGAVDIGPTTTPTGATLDHTYVLPELVAFFPRSLERVYEGQFGDLRPALQAETAGFVAEIVYRSLATQTSPFVGIDFRLLSDKQFSLCSAGVSNTLASGILTSGRSPVDVDCDSDNHSRVEYACDLAFAVRAGLEGDSAGAEADLRRAVAALVAEWDLQKAPVVDQVNAVAGIVDTMLASTCAGAAGAPASCPTAGAVTAAITSLDAALKVTHPASLQDALVALVDQWKAFHGTGAKPLSVAAFIDATSHLAKAATALCPAAAAGPVDTACALFGKEKSIFASSPSSPPDFSPALLVAEWQMQHSPTPAQLATVTPIVQALLANAPASRDSAVATAVAALNAALPPPKTVDLTKALGALFDQAKAVTSPRVPTLSDIVNAAGSVASVLTDACSGVTPGTTPTACGFLAHGLPVLQDGTALFTILDLSAKQDPTDAVQLAVNLVFSHLEGAPDVSATTKEELTIVERFSHAVVQYVMEAVPGQAPTEPTREAFRSAATDMVVELSKGGGIDRRFWGSFVSPRLGLQFAWSPSYVNPSLNSSRSAPTLTWATFRLHAWRSRVAYSAIELSLIDALAPLTEIVARDNSNGVHFANQGAVAANFLTPRLDVVAGIPVLSTHLLVGGSLAYRPVIPWFDHAATATAPTTYAYDAFWNGHGDNWSNGFEVSVSARYAM